MKLSSGTSHRLRIALRLKGLQVDSVPVGLRTEQHLTPEYKALNPQGLVPALAEIYPVPQLEIARQFKLDVAAWPRIEAIDAGCAEIEAFRLSANAFQFYFAGLTRSNLPWRTP